MVRQLADVTNALSTIPNWDAQDYKTSAPFEWLYAYKDNKFLMAQLREEIKSRAGAVGVKNFVSLWNAYLETKRQQNGVKIDNFTEFDGQPVELLCGEYVCKGDMITVLDMYGFERLVCPHPIMPIRRLVNIDTGEVKIELAYKRGNRWSFLIMDKATLVSAQKILDLARVGIAVDSENARDLVKYLSTIENLNYDQMPETHSVGRLGWIRGHGFSPYVDNIVFEGDSSFRNVFTSVAENGDYSKWLECARKARRESVVARILLAASFASVLVEPCNALSFFVHAWGAPGCGKTLGMMLAASVWADPSGEYIRTFNSTSVGLELAAGFLTSLPLCVDELQSVKDRKNFDSTIYLLAEGIGKSRGARGGGLQRLQTWKNCIISTGEMPISNPNSGGGAINRVIEIDCNGEKLFGNPYEVVATIKSNYGFAGKRFVEAMSNPEWMDCAKMMFESTMAELNRGESTEKQAMAAALLITADAYADQIIFQDHTSLTIGDIEPYLATKSAADQNQRAYEWLLEFIASNPNRFAISGINTGETWGLQGADMVYIIKSIFDQKMMEAGFNPTSFLSWAKRKGVIECDSEGRNTRTKWISGSRVRCVFLKQPKYSDNESE